MPIIVDVAFNDNSARRKELRPAHVEYLEKNLALLLAAGAKLSADNGEPHGSLYLLDCETMREAEAFIAEEPYYKGGHYRTLTYSLWRKAFFDHVRQKT